MNASQVIAAIEAALPTVIQLAKLVAAALDGDQKVQTAIQGAVASLEPQNSTSPASEPQPGKRGPGRPKKGEAVAAAAPPAAGTLDIGAVTSLCSEKMKELGGKLGGDEAAARQMVKEAVKAAAGVERLKEVPADKLEAVRSAVSALDVPEQGGEEGELDEF